MRYCKYIILLLQLLSSIVNTAGEIFELCAECGNDAIFLLSNIKEMKSQMFYSKI